MEPTHVRDPNYFHKVVDCQWACPAHTNVPGYIRLIAQERYADAYMLNRESNVFPGILGRTCDRPCEPACRRERVDGKPVAICRPKRVASDLRGDGGAGGGVGGGGGAVAGRASMASRWPSAASSAWPPTCAATSPTVCRPPRCARTASAWPASAPARRRWRWPTT